MADILTADFILEIIGIVVMSYEVYFSYILSAVKSRVDAWDYIAFGLMLAVFWKGLHIAEPYLLVSHQVVAYLLSPLLFLIMGLSLLYGFKRLLKEQKRTPFSKSGSSFIAAHNQQFSNKIKFLLCIIFAVAILALIGWAYNIPLLKSVYPGFVAMPFLTALSFVFTAVIIYTLAVVQESNKVLGKLVFTFSGLVILTIMSFFILVISSGLGEKVLSNTIDENNYILMSPEIVTILLFLLIGLIGVLAGFNIKSKKLLEIMRLNGLLMIAVGISVFIGYALNLPWLYFNFPMNGVGMAINTAFLFLCAGISFLLINKQKNKRH